MTRALARSTAMAARIEKMSINEIVAFMVLAGWICIAAMAVLILIRKPPACGELPPAPEAIDIDFNERAWSYATAGCRLPDGKEGV